MPKTPTQTDRPTEDITWDGSPLTRYAWQKDLLRRLTRANAAFHTLCEHGYVLERSRVICSTPSHRDNLYNNNVKRQSFQQPCELLTFTPINAGLALVAVPPTSAERYTIAPEILIETDSRMFEEIAETISNPKRREDYYHISAGSGVALLRILSQELAQQSPEIGAWAASEIANLQLTGVSSPTVAAFDDYRQKYEDLNGQLDAPATDASLAAHYFAQVRRLGDMLSTKLKLRMTTDSATGDLGKTVAAITAVLNEEEATSGSGQSFYGGRDPFRGKGNSSKGRGKGKGKPQETQKRVWIDGKDDICTVCNGEEQGGRHLRKDCPRNTSNTAGGRGGARAASSYPQFEYNNDDAVLLDADAIAQAFDDGLPPDDDARLDEVSEEAAPVGAARVARGRGPGIDTVFRNERHFIFTRNAGLLAPFRRVNGSFMWEVGLLSDVPDTIGAAQRATTVDDKSRPYNYKGEIHAASAHSHIHALPANGVAAILHRRLHVGIDHIRRLSRFSIDAPAHVASASRLTCEGCSEANATRLPHAASRYQPSHVGRLIHADMVGPFLASRVGAYKYGLVLVDDHSRYKSIKFLRAKSEAPNAVRAFVAELNAGLGTRAVAPVRVVGSLHTDNAGEFLSREFKELLDSELVSHTTCPPYVHQLNGVAERAIRSILQLARAYLTSSGVDAHHWPAAFEMAVDVLNRTSGPPSSALGGGASSFEVLTGVPPRIMHIMPFGCRAFAVKPRSQYSKTTLDPRAWVGVNLGRCSSTPGAYNVYLPSTGRLLAPVTL